MPVLGAARAAGAAAADVGAVGAGGVGRCQFVRWMFVVLDSMVVIMVL